ncbi:MAG: hypothetical protein EOO25_20520 [Comamonadaceae bacterium]|nr:MAG: hypothetical protein EOO25_20520 [Comamonadaceae bacterium]
MAGMALDLQGPVQVLHQGRSARLQLLANLAPGTRIELPAGARASLSLYASRSIYRLTGPGLVEVTGDGLKVIHGAAPQVRSMGEKQVAAAQTGNLIPGAYRMRALQLARKVVLTAPETGSVLLDTRPHFAWEAADDAPYTVTLQAEAGGLRYSTVVQGKRWTLPEGIQLDHGKSYDWTVSYTSPANGEKQSAGGRFSLATQDEAAQLRALRPAEADPVEDWVFYAVMLQQRQMRAEARGAWHHIARQRPDLERAADLAR